MNKVVSASEWTHCALLCLNYLETQFQYSYRIWLNPDVPRVGSIIFENTNCVSIVLEGDSSDFIYMYARRLTNDISKPESYLLSDLVQWFVAPAKMDVRLLGSNPLWNFPLKHETMKRMFGFWGASLRRYCAPILQTGFDEWDSIDRMIEEERNRFEEENPEWWKGVLSPTWYAKRNKLIKQMGWKERTKE